MLKAEEVDLLVVGRKIGNVLVVEGEEVRGHQDNPVESAGGGPRGDAE